MKELADILEAYPRYAGVPLALATVVRVEGSAYRRAGARMLIAGDGHTVGGVSGGCLERDVIQRAGAIMLCDQPALVRYETTLDSEAGAGYSLGCGGTIDVLIESLNTSDGNRLMQCLTTSRSRRQVVATVISKRHPSITLGQRLMVDEAQAVSGQIGGDASCRAIAEDACILLTGGENSVIQYPTAAGAVDVFFQLLEPPLELFIFGGGSDVVPLVEFAKSLGWRVTVVDVRSSPMDPGRVWTADRVIRCRVDSVSEHVSVSQASAAVVMTHQFSHDSQLVRWLSEQRVGYLGLLGPRHRTEQLLGDLAIDALHSPVGLDIGADNPQEVALSIVAEITAVMRGRSGRSLRSTDGPIHVGSPIQGQQSPRALLNSGAIHEPVSFLQGGACHVVAL